MKDKWIRELNCILDSFKGNIQSINDYIDFIIDSNNILSSKKDILDKLDGVEKSLLESYFNKVDLFLSSDLSYNTVIIALSSCFEQYFDSLLVDIIKYIEDLYRYSELPLDIKKRNISAICDYIDNPTKFSVELDVEQLMTTLYSNKEDSYKLQSDLMAEHTANLRYKKINELVCNIGIKNLKERIIKTPIFGSDLAVYIEQKTGVTRFENCPEERLYADLERLIEDRNQVAHKWTVQQRDNILVIKETYLKFIALFGEAVFQVFISYLIELSDNKDKLTNLDPIILVPTENKRVACVNSKDYVIKVNGYIYFKNTKNFFFYSPISRIQVNHKEKEQAPLYENIGIELLYEINQKYKLYLENTD